MSSSGERISGRRYQGLVFDLDGTLVDSYAAITECFNFARTALGEPPVSEETVRGLVGHGLESLMEDAVGPQRAAEAVRLFRVRYDAICEENTCLLPGVARILPALAARDIKMGVATNKPTRFAVRILKALGMMPYLEAVLGPGEGIPAKPHPRMLLQVLEQLGVQPSQALYVGDMGIDIETARRAGVDVWVMPTGSSSREALMADGPDRIFADFAVLGAELLSAESAGA